MRIYRCDRCGNLTEPKEESIGDKIKKCFDALTFKKPQFDYEISRNEIPLDLCDDCKRDLKDWFENPIAFRRSWDDIGKKPTIPEDDREGD